MHPCNCLIDFGVGDYQRRLEADRPGPGGVDHEPLLEQRSHNLRISVPRRGLLLEADDVRLAQVVANLLTNALTYTAEGGIVRAEVVFEEGAGVLILSDSGAGFSQNEAQRMGMPFERFDRAGTVTGAGLGLAIAMELARRMGGAMRLAGEGGHGTRMELRLPRL